MPRAKQPSRVRNRNATEANFFNGWGIRMAVVFVLVSILILLVAIWYQGRNEHLAADDVLKDIPKPTPAVTPLQAQQVMPQPSATPSPTPTPKSTPTPNQAKVYSEPGPASLVSQAPEGWVVGDLDGVKVRVGPVVFTDGHKAIFLVHAYQFVPTTKPGGVYVIEPGLDSNGTGTTIPEAIDQLDAKVNETRDALDGLEDSILALKRMSDAAPKGSPTPVGSD